ncbi:MAG TPA: hypothetical protein VK211_08795 [Kamptonema sp.]|nr:hypothetical protein [Kamptonema sp.]
MKNVTQTSVNNYLNNTSTRDAAIPDPGEWVAEHHFLASFVHTLSHLKQAFPESIFDANDCCDSSEGQLLIDGNTRDLLKANYTDDHWQYLENYLLAWEA